MALPPITPFFHWPPLLAWLIVWAATCEAYFGDWSALGGRPHEPTCVDIPKNMSLCSDIGYDKMRLPNLLDHDTLTEVQQQSGSWVPLLNVRCHPHTKLFLCSLFTPVCLENQIFPCRSLCVSVQENCESRMKTYGYHWPEMLRCDKFPQDNDMCIKAPPPTPDLPSNPHSTGSDCEVCDPVDTYENILDNFCRADTVIRARIKRQKGRRVSLQKAKPFKMEETKKSSKKMRLLLGEGSSCCSFSTDKQKYLIMGIRAKKNFITPTFVLPWKKSRTMRQAVRMFRNLDCNDPNLFSPTADDGTIVPKVESRKTKKRKRMRKRTKNRKKKGGKGPRKRKNRKRTRERKPKPE